MRVVSPITAMLGQVGSLSMCSLILSDYMVGEGFLAAREGWWQGASACITDANAPLAKSSHSIRIRFKWDMEQHYTVKGYTCRDGRNLWWGRFEIWQNILKPKAKFTWISAMFPTRGLKNRELSMKNTLTPFISSVLLGFSGNFYHQNHSLY